MMDLPYLGSMWGAQKLDGDCALFYGLRGNAMQSCDFGTTWDELDTRSEASISGGAVDDGQVLLAANSGWVMVRDDGDAWSATKHSSGVDFAAAVALGDGKFLLVGEDGVFRFPEPATEGDGDE